MGSYFCRCNLQPKGIPMTDNQTPTIECKSCNRKLHFPKIDIKSIKYCPYCSARINQSVEDIREKIKTSVSSYIDIFGRDFVINTIKGIEISKPFDAKASIINGFFEDPRDGELYKTVCIDGTEWFAENFRFRCKGSLILSDNQSNLKTKGRLYTYEAAMKYAPSGWRLPTPSEWEALIQFAKNNTGNATNSLMHKDSWECTDSVLPTDDFGFGIYAAGYADDLDEDIYAEDDSYSEISGFWADNTLDYKSLAPVGINSYFISDAGWKRYYKSKDYSLSVRLVRQ